MQLILQCDLYMIFFIYLFLFFLASATYSLKNAVCLYLYIYIYVLFRLVGCFFFKKRKSIMERIFFVMLSGTSGSDNSHQQLQKNKQKQKTPKRAHKICSVLTCSILLYNTLVSLKCWCPPAELWFYFVF